MLVDRVRQKPFSAIEQQTITDGVDTIIGVTAERLYAELDGNYVEARLSRREMLLATFAIKHMDRPFFCSEFENTYGLGMYNTELSTADVHKCLRENAPIQITSHFVQYGRGRGTRYVFLQDNKNVRDLYEREFDEIQRSGLRLYEKRRRIAALDALAAVYENDFESPQDTSGLKKAVAASAFIVAVGGVGTYYHYHHRKKS